MKNSAEVYLGVDGDFDPADFTEFVGISPTAAWKKGTRVSERQIPKVSIWNHSSGSFTGEIVDVYNISHVLIKSLISSRQLIRDALQKWNLQSTLQTVLHVSTNDKISTPVVGYSADTIRFFSYIGASIDVDIYRR